MKASELARSALAALLSARRLDDVARARAMTDAELEAVLAFHGADVRGLDDADYERVLRELAGLPEGDTGNAREGD